MSTRTSFFFYLQLRSTLKDSGISLQSPLVPHPIRKLPDSVSDTGGRVSRVYRFMLQQSYGPLALDSIWRRDVPDLKATFDWDRVWVDVSLASRNPDHQQIHYNYTSSIFNA